MKKEMLINVLQPEECRIAIVENGVLEELYVERTSHESYTGNIYKGKVVNLEPAIQAAFVDFSVGRNGFLHVSDVEPQYYGRNQAADEFEAPAGPAHGPGAGARSRDSRRERDRGRDDRRRSRPDPLDEPAPPSPPAHPRGEDRYRGEDRARADDRPRERERPDHSVRGRRDRSEMPRRFGEGLVEDRDLPPVSPPPLTPESASHEPPSPSAQEHVIGPGEPSLHHWPEELGSTWDLDRESQRDRERLRDRESRFEEPDEPRWKSEWTPEPFDPDLPPSRTQRTRIPPPTSQFDESDLEDRGQTRHAAGGPEVKRHDPERETPFGEGLGPEPPAARESRRGRGRGRSSPAKPPRGLSSPDEPVLERDDFGDGVEPTPTVEDLGALSDDESRFQEPPRRRSGRAAIRSRGGERGAEPERTREDTPPPAAGGVRPTRGVADADLERYRSPEPERGRTAESPDVPRERGRAHSRAGEPGYVPRRERLRADQEPEAGSSSALGWSERTVEPQPDIESREFLAPEEDIEDGTGGPARSGAREVKRRRRRRGRRRDRERPEAEAPPTPTADELTSPFDDFGPEIGHEPSYSRARPIEDIPGEELDEIDLDFEDIQDADEMDFEDDESAAVGLEPGSARSVEEEIDPELEQEIRKEIDEIEELEREMGLRGPVEARPRRGDDAARAGRPSRGRGMIKPPIQEVFRRGDEVLVQVIKESIGTKGPTLSTYISIPGRYLVLMPGLNRVGVSRKIVDEGQRRKLREIMHELNPPKGLGFIVRTAGLERTKRELARDLAYLLRLWKVILRRIKKTRAPGPIYQESDMITRTIRDIFTSEIDTIWIDEPAAFERAQEFLRVVMPRFVNRIKLYDEKVPLFHKYGIEDEIAKIQRRHVPLPEGGSIVIDQTEALVAIDVNSGNFRVEDDAEKTAYEMNLRAAKEIARQLRLRDLGGVIVNDFIDMREERHRRGVERALREAIKRDRARTKILRMSAFGLIEMTRQRIRPSLKRSIYEDCPNCAGAGVVKTAESMAIDVMRLLALASHRDDIRRINITVSPGVATYLSNRKRREIARIESESHMTITVGFKENVPAEYLQIDCYDPNSSEVRLIPLPAPTHKRGH
jgi:ribonuclease E